MGSLTQYARKALLDHTLGLAAFSMPTAYAALFSASPSETGSLLNEISGAGYDRVDLTSLMTATVLGTGLCQNGSAVSFPSPSGDWGAVTYLAIVDSATPGAGNVLMFMPLASALIRNSGDPAIEFVPGSIQVYGLFDDPSDLTKYLSKKWLDHLLGIAAFTEPSGLYLAMFDADPTSAGTLTDEIAVGGYARQGLTASMAETVLATGIAASDADLQFPDPTASYSVTHYGIMDALTSGNMLFRRARTSTLNVSSGSAPVRVESGQLAVQAA